MNKIVKIKVKSISSIDLYRYHILIFDKNKLVFDDYTKNGEIYFNGEYQKGYRVIIFNPLIFKKIFSIYCDKKDLNEFTISVENYLPKAPYLITAKLTDYNYKGLPILKGKIVLWNI